MLWLAIHLPGLPLTALAPAPHEAQAVVGSDQRLQALSAPAEALGLRVGMLSSTAGAIAPQLQMLPRQFDTEQQVLRQLAGWCLQFSSRVSLSPPCTLVLEVGGSLRLFGGLAALQQRIATGLQALGHRGWQGVAPSIRGAEVLARAAGRLAALRRVCQAQAELRQRLAELPLELLGWPDKTRQRLEAVGMRSIGECLQLPRDGLRQRYGRAVALDLDQLTGLAPDPRPWFAPPPRYERSLPLFSETRELAHLAPGFARLFDELAAELQGRDCGLQQLRIGLQHARADDTLVRIGLQSPNRDPARWTRLLDTHFQTLRLSEPVRGIRLLAMDFAPLRRPQQSLLPETRRGERQALLEQLSARLGPAAVHELRTLAEHRPERAWRPCEPGQGGDTVGDERPRPLWLLPAPEPIDFARFALRSGPERLESGWWDEADCRRDYYQARGSDGRRLWVFREHGQPSCWYLHGLFA